MSDTGNSAAATPVILSADPGYAALDAETKGYFENRGLDKKPLFDAVIESAKAHREANKHLGAPAEELVRFPKDPNSPDWDKVYQRLGKPADPKEYDFTGVKLANGDELSESLKDILRPALAAANTPKDKAPEIARAIAKHFDSTSAADMADRTAKLGTEREALKVNWGANVEANMFIAKQGAAKLGVTPEEVTILENTVGYAKTMEIFRKAGEAMGEARFVANGAPGGTGVMTADQAVARLTELKQDTAWGTRYMGGDREAAREFDALTRIISAAGRR
jgi:hypothetical protein